MYIHVQNSGGTEEFLGENLPPLPVFQTSPFPIANTIAIYKHILYVVFSLC